MEVQSANEDLVSRKIIYRREVDGLRAIAILSVVFFHADIFSLPGGFFGVDIFFVISGYLITKILLNEMQVGSFSLVSFLDRRIRRISPALFLVTVTSVLLAWAILLPGDLIDFSKSLLAIPAFLSNFVFWRQSGYFDTASELKPLLHTWSLAVEGQFYLFLPLFLIFLNRVKSRTIKGLAFVSLLLLSFYASTKEGAASFYLLPFRVWELLLGTLVAKLEFEEKLFKDRMPIKEILSALGLGSMFYAIAQFDSASIHQGGALLPVVGAAMVIAFSGGTKFVGRLLSLRLFVGIGLISYSLYLWHYPLLVFSRHFFDKKPEQGVLYGLLATIFRLAWLTWKFVEGPARSPHFLQRKKLYSVLGVGMLVIVYSGIYIQYSEGLLSRYSEIDRKILKMTNKDFGDYVETRFNLIADRSFDDRDPRLKVLIVGDSFAQDMVNVVQETYLNDQMQLAAFHIAAQCGNLNVSDNLEPLLEPEWLKYCKNLGWYRNQILKNLLVEADEIWLVSSWTAWQAPKVPESVRNIQNEYGKRVLVFGTKQFGSVSLRKIIGFSKDERQQLRNPILPEAIAINNVLRIGLSEDVFIDTLEIFCRKSEACALFDQNGRLISYDGSHLTQAGARFLGERLGKNYLVGEKRNLESTHPQSHP
jgi:peptidoglycan/LPS O-acetylase OafA/YrhL